MAYPLYQASLEILGYAVRAEGLPASSVGAPHIRQRLWWVADAECGASERHGYEMAGTAGTHQGRTQERKRVWNDVRNGSVVGRLADADEGQRGRFASGKRRQFNGAAPGREQGNGQLKRRCEDGGIEWLPCDDGKARPTQPGLQPLAYGVSARVGKLRAYGNAIVPTLAAEFVAAFME